MKYVVKSAFDSTSGYGNDGMGLAKALVAAGHDVHLMPMSVAAPIDQVTAALLTKWPDPPYDVEIVHRPPNELVVGKERSAVRRAVAWSMWEFEQFRDLPPLLMPEAPEIPERAYFTNHLRDFDLFLAYDEVTHKALAGLTETPSVILQGGYDPTFWAQGGPPRDWGSDTFRFAMVGRMDRRKNPWAAIKAFCRLRDEYGGEFDAELHLKSHMHAFPQQLAERWPGLVSHAEWWPPTQMRRFYSTVHCLLAPSTGEGKNVPALEAMTTGIPVIATDYSGHRQWLQPDWGYPLRWSPKEFERGWAAEADIDHLAELMWHVYTHRSEAKMKGELAARTIPAMCSWDSVVRRLQDKLNEVPERSLQWVR